MDSRGVQECTPDTLRRNHKLVSAQVSFERSDHSHTLHSGEKTRSPKAITTPHQAKVWGYLGEPCSWDRECGRPPDLQYARCARRDADVVLKTQSSPRRRQAPHPMPATIPLLFKLFPFPRRRIWGTKRRSSLYDRRPCLQEFEAFFFAARAPRERTLMGENDELVRSAFLRS